MNMYQKAEKKHPFENDPFEIKESSCHTFFLPRVDIFCKTFLFVMGSLISCKIILLCSLSSLIFFGSLFWMSQY